MTGVPSALERFIRRYIRSDEGKDDVNAAVDVEQTVESVFGREGDILAEDGDYSAAQIQNFDSVASDAAPVQSVNDQTGDVDVETDAPVDSVFGRTGSVSAQSGDYSHSQLSGVTSSQHHSRYTDSEASSAAPVSSVNGQTGSVNVAEAGALRWEFLASDTVTSASDRHSWFQDNIDVSDYDEIRLRIETTVNERLDDDPYLDGISLGDGSGNTDFFGTIHAVTTGDSVEVGMGRLSTEICKNLGFGEDDPITSVMDLTMSIGQVPNQDIVPTRPVSMGGEVCVGILDDSSDIDREPYSTFSGARIEWGDGGDVDNTFELHGLEY